VLSPLVDAGRASGAGAEARLFAALSAATIASVHRQLGRHAVARASDLEALALTDGTGEAAFDALVGTGLRRGRAGRAGGGAAARLAEARARSLSARTEWWRQRVRLGWAEAEVQRLEGRSTAAGRRPGPEASSSGAEHGPRADGTSPRGWSDPGHRAGQWRHLRAWPGARGQDAAADPAPSPRRWPSRSAYRAAHLAGPRAARRAGRRQDPVESSRSLAAARSAVLTLAADLPPGSARTGSPARTSPRCWRDRTAQDRAYERSRPAALLPKACAGLRSGAPSTRGQERT
jgi:hypothetical protein